jgi:hypothetical protein
MSRQAIKNSLPIKTPYAVNISNIIINKLKEELNIQSCTLGSLGKKFDYEESGDIDIAINYEFTKENSDIIIKFILDNFSKYNTPEIYISPGFKIISFGYYYMNYDSYTSESSDDEDGVLQIAQIDLMFSNNLEYTQFMYHSPNYKNFESEFKGLYRTNLLTFIAGRKPVDKKPIYDENGNLTDYWKYTLTYDKGLMFTHKSYKGKKGLLKNPYTVKEDTEFITNDIHEIVKLILGEKATIADTNSFESLIKFIFSDNYIYKNKLKDIISDFIEDNRHNNEDVLMFIFNMYKEKFGILNILKKII